MIDDKIKALREAVEIIGTQSALAQVCGREVKQQHVWNWLNRPSKGGAPTGLPEKYALRVEAATEGRVPARRLCPEMFDLSAA